ncbi:Adenine permease AdeP [bacterium HR19]|nr:Adenine permease AdeP [bacterium HR19]
MLALVREILAGISTFSAMAYIIFVQPSILSSANADFYTVFFATCVSSAIATFLMGIWAKVPFAVAPAMGHNIFVSLFVVSSLGLNIKQALFINLLSALISLAISLSNVLPYIIRSIPDELKNSISAGIGLLIAFVGLQWGGIVVSNPGALVKLGDVSSLPFLATALGLAVAGAAYSLGIRWGVILGVAASAVFLWQKGFISFEKVIEIPKIPTELPYVNFFKPDIGVLIKALFILLFLDVFDTAGTLVGLFKVSGIEPDKKTVRRCFTVDSLGAVIGTLLGTTTLTTYVESAVGIQAGGRTKITSIVVALLFIASLFLSPIIKAIAGGIEFNGSKFYPQIAVPMIFVGIFMMSTLKINTEDITSAIPSFITILVMAYSLSISDGIAFGFISWTFLKLVSGKWNDLNPAVVILSLIFVAKFIFLG